MAFLYSFKKSEHPYDTASHAAKSLFRLEGECLSLMYLEKTGEFLVIVSSGVESTLSCRGRPWRGGGPGWHTQRCPISKAERFLLSCCMVSPKDLVLCFFPPTHYFPSWAWYISLDVCGILKICFVKHCKCLLSPHFVPGIGACDHGSHDIRPDGT